MTGSVDLDLHARLLSDEIDCDFDNGSFCRLHNNGGWTFQQSLLEHSQLNLQSNASYPTPTKPNQYICADWGGANGNTSSEESARSAELQAFISLPSPRHHHHFKGGNVLYLGAGPLWPVWTVEKGREKKNYSQKFGLCLNLNVRFSSHYASELTVKFRSSSQTVQATKMPGPLGVPTTASSFKERLIFLSYLASWIFSLPFSPSSSLYSLFSRQSSHQLKPPTGQWLHLTMPLDTHYFQPEAPLPFALFGYNGVCIDTIRVERCVTTIVSSLSWPPNNTLYLSLSLPPSVILSSTNNSTNYFNHPIFTGTFLFTVLLVILLVLLILICGMSIMFGRKRSNRVLKKKGKIEQKKVPLVIPSLDLMRSPSVSSLPAAVVHQRQLEETSYSLNDEFEETLNDTGCPNDGGHYSRFQRSHREISAQFPSSSAGRRDKRQSTAPLLSLQPFNWKRSTVSKSDAVDQINSPGGFQRFSLLLSINENNELVLISPEIANASSNEKFIHKKKVASGSFVVGMDSIARSTETSRSCSTSTTYTTTTAMTSAGTCRPLSALETEATLQEMAVSVSQLGRGCVGKRSDEDDNATDPSPLIAESITSSISCLSHDPQLSEQKSQDLS
ncbi:unnamed protein product [Rodentolepis nana]|uniref:MAM domain-containing protein n=1 Tax=Rodentolepis nana TaxID=102285 RepID=A0A0R3TK63_RODNA|nr:unnamed protein product [Rodentolepis nana]